MCGWVGVCSIYIYIHIYIYIVYTYGIYYICIPIEFTHAGNARGLPPW